jgi:hypothetical protein
LIRFENEGGETYIADLGPWETSIPKKDTKVKAYASIDELSVSKNTAEVIFEKVCLQLTIFQEL